MPAEVVPVRQPLLEWMFSALGVYVVLLPAVALLTFVLILIVVIRGRGAMSAAALVLTVPVPMLVGIVAAVQGMIQSYSVIAASPTTPKPAEVAAGISMALAAPLVGMLLMAPGYVLATLGAVVRSVLADRSETARRAP